MKLRTIGLTGSILIGFASLLTTQFGSARSKPTNAAKAKNPPKAAPESAYFESWDPKEKKSCSTYSGEPHLLICDESKLEWHETFLSLVASNFRAGWNHDESYRRAFAFCRARAQQLTVSSSQAAWPNPQTGLMLTNWTCIRNETVTCKFAGRYR